MVMEDEFVVPEQSFLISGGKLIPLPSDEPHHMPVPVASVDTRRLLRLDTVMFLTGLFRTTLWRMEREGRFPRCRKIGKHTVAWRESEVQAWLAKR